MATLSREEVPDPSLDRLLLLFWAHYIEDGPHLLCTGSLQVVTENRMLLITSKKRDICKCKGKIGWTGYTHPWKVQHRFQEVTLKICSKCLLPQFRMREFQQKASLKAAQVQCRPDSPQENLSMGVGPVCWTSFSTALSKWELGPRHAEQCPIVNVFQTQAPKTP